MPAPRTPFRRHLIVLATYSLLSLLLTLPLALRFTTHVPGDGIDDPALAWNLWWVKQSLVDRQANPFASGWMFYPIGVNLAFYTLTVWNGLLSVPLQTAFSVVVASNLLLLSSFVLSGYGAWLLCLHVLQTVGSPRLLASRSRTILDGAAFLGGLIFAFSSAKVFYAALGQFNIASSQWIPFAVLYTLRSLRPGAGWREPVLAALFLTLQAWAELTYVAFLAIFVAMAALWRLIQILWPAGRRAVESRGRAAARLARNLAVMALLLLAGLTPILANMLPDMRAEGDFLVEGGGFADVFSADLAGYALPTQLHPLLGDLIRTASHDSAVQANGVEWQVNKGQHLTLGVVGLALAVAGVWTHRRRRETWFWVAAATTFFLLTLGPSIRWMGHDTGIPGPFRLLQNLPFLKGNRYPSRFSVMLLLCVAPLASMGGHWVLARWTQRQAEGKSRIRPAALVAGLMAALLIFENLSAPLPLASMETPAIYQTIAAEPGDFAVLDLPLGWRNGFNVFGKQDLIIMAQQWWQTSHGRPILGGNTSRNPEFKFRYFLDAPLIGPLTVLANAGAANPHVQEQMADALAALRDGDPALGGNQMLTQAAQDAAQVLHALNIRFVVVHEDKVPAELVRFVEDYLPVTLAASEGDHRLYRVAEIAPATRVEIAPAAQPLARGEGWSGSAASAQSALPAWAHRRDARLLVPPVEAGPYTATVRARAAGPGQTLSLVINGVETPAQPLPTEWSELVFAAPDGALLDQVNEVRLRFGQTVPVETQFGQVGSKLNLLVEGAGLEAGNYAHIWLNGRDVSPNQRGYNAALIDSATGELIAAGNFDTHADPDASQALVEFLRQAQPGHTLALAVKDTASDLLSAEAAQALTDLGLTDLRGRLRWSQAAIVTLHPDADPSTMEGVDGVQSAIVGQGAGWREEEVAAQVEWLRLERTDEP